MLVAALAGSLLTRKIGAETALEAERMRSSDSAPIAAAN
jgi:hypothetical protein